MNRLWIVILLLCPRTAFGQAATAETDVPVVFNTIEELSAGKGNANVAIVKERLRGGTFIFSKDKQNTDNGVVFKSVNKGYWVRQYNRYEGVDVAWFGAKMDSVTNDAAAMKSALNYDHVVITGLVKLDGKLIFGSGKTISFASKGAFLLADSCKLTFDAYLKTEDYSYIFKGNGYVVFGQKSIPYVSPCWFGAKADFNGRGNNGTNNAPIIEKAIIAAEKVSDVYLPPTDAGSYYKIDTTITIFKKIHFYTFRFHGGGTTITGSNSDKATTIFANFRSGPAINIQGSRRSYITDFKLLGKNEAPKKILQGRWKEAIYATPSYDTITYFYDKDIHKNYVGIATDAEKDSKLLSADIQFERLQIEGFYLGISINDAGKQQGDRMRVTNSQINYCTYGISVGNPQARACHFENVDMNYVYIGYTNSTFGSGQGSEFQITGGQYCNLYKLFHIQPSNLGQCIVTGMYAEGGGSIGEIGYGGVHDNSFLFTGCSFLLFDETGFRANYGTYSKFYTLTAFANVTFEGCNFWSMKPYIAFCAGNQDISIHSLINFNGCTFYRSKFFHGWGNINVNNCHFAPNGDPEDINQIIRTRLDGSRRYNTGYYATTVIPMFDGISKDSSNPASAMQIRRTIPMFYSVQDGRSIILDPVKNDTISFSYTNELEQNLFRYIMPDDKLGTTLNGTNTEWDNPSLKVLSINHDTRKITALMYTETFNFDTIGLYTNCFFTTIPITGDVNEGSPTVTNTQNESLLRPGDFITCKDSKHYYRVNKIDAVAHTITLIDPVNEKSSQHIELYNLKLYKGL